jgi:type IV pilus assembly protein PilE
MMIRGLKRQGGVSLMELMIVVSIIGILAAAAYPSYKSYRLRSNRQVGGDCVVDAERRLEVYYAHQNAYPTDLSDTSLRYSSAAPKCGDQSLYTLSLVYGGSCPTQASGLGYCVVATASGSQTSDGNLQLIFNANPVSGNINDRVTKQRIVGGATISGW